MLPSVRPLEAPVPAPAVMTLGRYQVLEEIGAGMMGVVYRARDPLLNRIVALKTVRTKYSMEGQERASFEQRFLVEARAAAALSHPGVVTVHDCGKDTATGTLFIAFEHLEGVTLDEKLSSGRPMEWPEALVIVLRLAEALDHAHRRGIIHRDIKPANIMLLPSGEPKIMDFGIAKLPTSALTLAGDILGTPSYMSPEQAVGEPVDGRSDLFSLGVVLYALLTGKRAFEGASLPAIVTHVVHTQPSLPSALVPGLPPSVDELVDKALAKCPEARFQEARAFAVAILALLASAQASGSPGPTAARRPRPPSRGQARRLLGLFGFLVASALAAPALVTLGSAARSQAPAPSVAPAPPATSPAAAPMPAAASKPVAVPKPVFVPAPGRLEISFEHSLKDGTLRVFVDDRAVLSQPLDKGRAKKLLINRTAQGRPLSVPAGSHTLRLHVQAGKDAWSGGIRGSFRSGDTLHLKARLGGLFGKKLSLEWRG